MSKAQRNKGLRGELEVWHHFAAAGLQVKNVEKGGDNLVVCADGLVLHVETKRQETLKMDAWSRQAEAEAPEGTIPIVPYRRSREPWRVSLRLEDLISIPSRLDW